MGVEFFEEGRGSQPLQTAAGMQGARGGMASTLMSWGLTKNVSGANVILLAAGLLFLFGSYFVFSLSSDAGAHKPTDAEIKAMADLLKKK